MKLLQYNMFRKIFFSILALSFWIAIIFNKMIAFDDELIIIISFLLVISYLYNIISKILARGLKKRHLNVKYELRRNLRIQKQIAKNLIHLYKKKINKRIEKLEDISSYVKINLIKLNEFHEDNLIMLENAYTINLLLKIIDYLILEHKNEINNWGYNKIQGNFEEWDFKRFTLKNQLSKKTINYLRKNKTLLLEIK